MIFPPPLPRTLVVATEPEVLVTVVVDPFHPQNGRRVHRVPWRAGAMLADYLPAEVRRVPPNHLVLTHNGAPLSYADAHVTPIRPDDGLTVTIAPGVGIVLMIAYAAINLAWNTYDGRRKARTRKRWAEQEAKRLQDSVMLRFDGTFPTTQPGRRIPVLYGEMRVAGQCVYTQRFFNSAGKQVLDGTFVISHGEVAGLVAGSVEINGQPLSKFPTVSIDTQVGTNAQMASTVLKPMMASAVRNTPGNALVTGAAGTLYVTQPLTTGFRLLITFPNGLFAASTTRVKTGSGTAVKQVLASAETTFTVRIRSYPSGSFGAAATFKTGAQRTSAAFNVGYGSGPLTADRYEIEIKRTVDTIMSAGSTPSFSVTSTAVLAVVSEYQEVTPLYPNLATLNISALAAYALGGRVPLVTAVWQGRKVPVWNGDTPATFTNTYTRNPAWVIYDLLTNPIYGAGGYVPAAEIDLPSFAAAATFCDGLVNTPDGGTEARSLCDFYLDGDIDVLDAIVQIAADARLRVIRGFGNLKLIPDGTGTAVQLFTMGNIVPNSYKHGYRSNLLMPNRVSVDFLNAEQHYHHDVAQIEDPLVLVNAEELTNFEMSAPSVTRHTQATRIAKWTYLEGRYQREQIEFEVGADALAVEYGDVFVFIHEVTRPGDFYSGRIGAGSTTTTVKLDHPIRVPIAGAGEVVRLYVRYLNGAGNDTQEQNPVQIADQNQLTDLITLESPQAFTYAPQPGDLFALATFGTVFEQRKLWKVVEITRTQAHRRKITAIPYRAEVYVDADITPSDIILATDYATPS